MVNLTGFENEDCLTPARQNELDKLKADNDNNIAEINLRIENDDLYRLGLIGVTFLISIAFYYLTNPSKDYLDVIPMILKIILLLIISLVYYSYQKRDELYHVIAAPLIYTISMRLSKYVYTNWATHTLMFNAPSSNFELNNPGESNSDFTIEDYNNNFMFGTGMRKNGEKTNHWGLKVWWALGTSIFCFLFGSAMQIDMLYYDNKDDQENIDKAETYKTDIENVQDKVTLCPISSTSTSLTTPPISSTSTSSTTPPISSTSTSS